MLPSELTSEERAALDLAVRHELWRKGDLSWKRDAGQQAWVERFHAREGDTVWNIGRQRGKTFGALTMALECALSVPNAVIRYCAKTKDSAAGIVEPTLKLVLEDCPEDLKPVPGRSEYVHVFPSTGAELVIFGTDAQSFDKGRGPRTHLQLLDECGFYQDLERVESALLPSLQTTGGKALYLSSPAESVGHPYTNRIRAAMASGNYEHDTFWSNPRVVHEAIVRKEAALRGMTREEFLASTYFRREYLAEIVTEESRAAVPGWNQDRHNALVREYPRPKFFDAYVSLDLGFGDPHAALFGFLDFAAATLVIEDELELRHVNTGILADGDKVKGLIGLKEKETALWGERKYEGKLRGLATMNDLPEWLREAARPDAPPQPYIRVGDNDPLALSDLHGKHGISFLPTRKDEKHLAADAVDILIRQGRIVINPRCRRLIAQLYSTVWNKQRTEWERTALDHGDLIDALIYMVRNVRWHIDPRPANYGLNPENTWMPPKPDGLANVRAMFGARRKT